MTATALTAQHRADGGRDAHDLELTIMMPCLNEAETIATCVRRASDWLRRSAVAGEVLVSDNGSTDGSQALAAANGARVVAVAEKGYGAAIRGGIAAARGRYIIVGDADQSYDFGALDPFVEKLREGYDLVVGNRFQGGIAPGAMPALHRYLGNPVLSFLGRLLFRAPIGDFHCGLRGFSREAMLRLGLSTPGMEFASEQIVKAALNDLKIAEVPTTLSADGRSRPSHLRTWRDGWRHLRFLLIHRPRWLFLYPGSGLTLLGTALIVWLIPGPRELAGLVLDIHTMLYAAVAAVAGFQAVNFAVMANDFAVSTGVLPQDPLLTRLGKRLSLEVGLVSGFSLLAVGVAGLVYAVVVWGSGEFGALSPSNVMRIVIPSAALFVVGLQLALSSFFLALIRSLR
ncbi:MAG TPA: glycosyltransferase family 2 protein [Alphaproteobacteria bacterium]|nr:glycosyltransferase family 2 protein [Alphaproteobacteria bacterium]